MNFLKKRETPVQNIAFIAIMSAINVVFVLISSLLPVLLFLLVFILPLTSVMVTLYCKKSYFPIYFLSTLLLCFGVTMGFSVFDTFIYVLPSMVVGFIFGISLEKQFPAIYILIINSIVLYGFTYLTFLFIEHVIAQVNLFNSIYTIIGLENFAYKQALTHIFTYIIAQIQIILTYIVIRYQAKRLGLNINLKVDNRIPLYCITIAGGILAALSYFLFKDATLLFVLIVLPVTVYELIDLMIKKEIWIYVAIGVMTLAFMFVFAFLYPNTIAPNQLILLYIFFGGATIIDLISNYCLKNKVQTIE